MNTGVKANPTEECTVCLYRRDGFIDGPLYPVHMAVWRGVSLLFEGEIVACAIHVGYITDEFPETLERIA